MMLFPRAADALFFGDEFALECIDGVWRDRFFHPLIEELHQKGCTTLLMQRGTLQRQPRSSPVLAANTIENWGPLLATGLGLSKRLAGEFPAHEAVVKFVNDYGAPTRALGPDLLRKKAASVLATAYGFEQVLRIVRPSICFMMSLGMGHALALACRRRGVLSVEVQRSGVGPRLLEYSWAAVPEDGYSVLPAVFWTWTEVDAEAVSNWSNSLKRPWHRGVCGGHPQLRPWLDDRNPETQRFDAKIGKLREAHPARLEILVALQNHDGYVGLWNDLADLIERASSEWRWWLRRHPYSPQSNKELGRLMTIRRPNVLIDEASTLPLPALLRHMDALVSIRSGAAGEASMFGLKPIFLSPVARDVLPPLFASGGAEIIDTMTLLEERLAGLSRATKIRASQPELRTVLSQLDAIAAEYSNLCGIRPTRARR